MDYGDTIITKQYALERWAWGFELCDVAVMLEDPQQIVWTLRRRPDDQATRDGVDRG